MPIIPTNLSIITPNLFQLNYIRNEIGLGNLHFFDAAAPSVDFSSVDMNKAFFASRYNKGDADYINWSIYKDRIYL